MEGSYNKVYINPNFKQKPIVNSVPLSSKNNMHVNPYFNQVNMQNHISQNIKRKIFVNPNFITPNYASDTSNSLTDMHFKPTSNVIHYNISHLNTACKQLPNQTEKENSDVMPSATVSKSRYALVRNNNGRRENVENRVNKTSSTIKIGRYKTERLSYIKSNLAVKEYKKPIQKLLPVTQISKLPSSLQDRDKRKYIKINKHNISANKSIETKLTFKKIIKSARKTVNNSLEEKVNRIPGRFKKNNIPCPLFTKYGKCLRNINGNCVFVHDKKHVSICRKFLKGVCHNDDCLLSHDISSKKMPTCYFYLKGNCNKDSCPYSHVKLSNKVKLCKQFLNGYCENGDCCTYRHVNKEVKSLIKHSVDLRRQYTCQSSAFIISKIKTKSGINKKNETKNSSAKSEFSSEEKSDPKCRYFGHDDREEQPAVCDVIQPNRCKLGSLPSFIKL